MNDPTAAEDAELDGSHGDQLGRDDRGSRSLTHPRAISEWTDASRNSAPVQPASRVAETVSGVFASAGVTSKRSLVRRVMMRASAACASPSVWSLLKPT